MSKAARRLVVLMKRDGPACYWCGREGERMNVDHVIPRCLGGSNALSNVVASCVPCNEAKGCQIVSGREEVARLVAARADRLAKRKVRRELHAAEMASAQMGARKAMRGEQHG